jgi:hypothetical protein
MYRIFYLFCLVIQLGMTTTRGQGLTILHTGNTQAALEECGCRPLQLGGLPRRSSLLGPILQSSHRTLVMDAGNFFGGKAGEKDDAGRSFFNLSAMQEMGYHAVNLGPLEFTFGLGFLQQAIDSIRLPFISTNLRVKTGKTPWFASWAFSLQQDSVYIWGISGELDPAMAGTVERAPAPAALKKAIPAGKGRRTYYILLSNASPAENKEIAAAFPQLDAILTDKGVYNFKDSTQAPVMGVHPVGKTVCQTDFPGTPTPAGVPHGAKAGSKHQHTMKLISLDANFQDDPDTRQKLTDFYTDFSRRLPGAETFRLFGDRPLEQDPENSYAGNAQCGRCHPAEAASYMTTRHSKAFDQLLSAQRHYDSRCLACHTTGFGYASGFTADQLRPELRPVGCEMCHGPGKRHVLAPDTLNIRKTAGKEICGVCHTAKWSPNLSSQFEDYYKAIRHDAAEPAKPEAAASAEPGAKLLVELFVMSECPYGLQAEQVLVPELQKYGDRVDFRLYFIAHEKGAGAVIVPKKAAAGPASGGQCQGDTSQYEGIGRFTSLHGAGEVEEDIRQAVLAQKYPAHLLPYLLERSRRGPSEPFENILRGLGWTAGRADSFGVFCSGTEAEQVLSENIKNTRRYGISASPTLWLNGEPWDAALKPGIIGRFLCQGKKNTADPVCAGLPACWTDADCRQPGQEYSCPDGGTAQARCVTQPAVAFDLVIVNDRACITCNTGNLVALFRENFPGVRIRNVDIASPEGTQLIRTYGLEVYPSFLADTAVQRSLHFPDVKHVFTPVKDRLAVDKKVVNAYHYLNRTEIPGRLDVYLTPQDPPAVETMKYLAPWIRESKGRYAVSLHYFAQTIKPAPGKPWHSGFLMPAGPREVPEAVRELCVDSLYPQAGLDFRLCRGADLRTRFENRTEETPDEWRRCGDSLKLDRTKLEKCTDGAAGKKLFLRSREESRTVDPRQSPVFLVNNTLRIQGFAPPVMDIIKSELDKAVAKSKPQNPNPK